MQDAPTGVEHDRWFVLRVFPDGRKEAVTLAGEPWEGSNEQANKRASVMQAEEHEMRFEIVQSDDPNLVNTLHTIVR